MWWILFEKKKDVSLGSCERICESENFEFMKEYVQEHHKELTGRSIYAEAYSKSKDDACRYRKIQLYTKTAYWIPVNYELQPTGHERRLY